MTLLLKSYFLGENHSMKHLTAAISFPEKYLYSTQGSEESLYPNCREKFSLILELRIKLNLKRYI